ncbi:a9196224-0c8d-4932-9f24-401cf5d60d7c [Thermothielavioides terrestris]|uniref:A9196224-0c8d-4932-9f24-401cf5d60d7c n=1 Tax=Thermothielavioides terrestris TaxID=2587410 RepID=A0A446BI53_9PEZI|nr:a9196224-0c8d-4932-9f24-401cf5d60d7c [Thermothielavioides terrestris]
MSAIQLSFSLRVSSGVKTVHLLGSWDNYSGQLPLSKDKSSSKSGTWKGTFRFQQATLQPGQRYWYYYIIDGYHVSHNPSEDSTVEPTTGRTLNILDVPKTKSSSSSSSSKSSSRKSTSSSKRHSSIGGDIPKGRPLSMSQIKAPKPVLPNATRRILENDFDEDELSSRFAATGIYDDYYYDDEDVITDFGAPGSPASSVGSSLSYHSDSSGSSGYSTPSSDCSSCTCERYGITRKGERVRLDCGGSRCSYEDSCSSSEDETEYIERSSRRNGIVVRQ